MQINSVEFILFVLAILVLYAIIPKKYKHILLLVSSYIFYISNSKKLTIFLILSTISIYFIALKIQNISDNLKQNLKEVNDRDTKKSMRKSAKSKQKKFLILGIAINIGILWFLKYSYLFSNLFNNISLFKAHNISLPSFKFLLPLGISYYTLQAISYIVDVYRGQVKADKNFIKVSLFLSFFPQMVEGPIGRYDKLADQLYEPHRITEKNLKYGSELMLWGYFKKMVIADRIAMYANEVFNNYTQYNGIVILIGIVCYTIQIYAEFSGGIDIVRGVATLFGITLEENFRRPFYAKSIDEFWRRWNITLGTWLRDYIFYPVSLSKVTTKISLFSQKIFKKSYIAKLVPVAFSLLFVWLGNGIWHGAGLKYVVYGLYYYVIMMLGKFLEPLFKKLIKLLKINVKAWSYSLFQMLRTFVIVCGGMLIFRADSLHSAKTMFRSIFNIRNNLEIIFNGQAFLLGGITGKDIVVLVISIAIFVLTSILREHKVSLRDEFEKQNLVFRWIVLYGLMFSIIIFGIYGKGYNVQNFIYGQF